MYIRWEVEASHADEVLERVGLEMRTLVVYW